MAKFKERRTEVAELQKICRYVDIALEADASLEFRQKMGVPLFGFVR